MARGAGRVKLAGMTPSSQTKRRSRLGATPECDPANELYDQTCSLLEGAQGLRGAAARATVGRPGQQLRPRIEADRSRDPRWAAILRLAWRSRHLRVTFFAAGGA